MNRLIRTSIFLWLPGILLPGFCRADSFEGIWRSMGYGQVLQISADSVAVYQEAGGRVMASRVERARRSGTRLDFEIVPFQYRSTFEMALAGEMLALSELETGREILFQRLERLPPETDRSDDPQANLEYFLQLFEDLYPAFEDRHVDWMAVSRRLRSRAGSELDEGRLFTLLREALDEIGRDGHIGITGPGGETYAPARRIAVPMIRSPHRERQLALVRDRYLQGEVTETANGKIFYGWVRPGIGYIHVGAVEGLAEDSSLSSQRAAADSALDELWAYFREARGLILDVRLNGGGFDVLALMIAGLFADGEHVAFSKRVRIQGTGRFSEPRLFLVKPREKSLSEKQLAVLTGPGTASGAEILVMAMMQFPGAQRLGAPTMGILSDTYLRELPNGWTVRLYSERYFTFDGGAYEAAGIPPQQRVDFTPEHLEAGRDPVLERAIQRLSGGEGSSAGPEGRIP